MQTSIALEEVSFFVLESLDDESVLVEVLTFLTFFEDPESPLNISFPLIALLYDILQSNYDYILFSAFQNLSLMLPLFNDY